MGARSLIPGWPYSFVAALETGRTSWTAVVSSVQLGPADDTTEITSAQFGAMIDRMIAAGQWKPGDPDVVIVADAGYDVVADLLEPVSWGTAAGGDGVADAP